MMVGWVGVGWVGVGVRVRVVVVVVVVVVGGWWACGGCKPVVKWASAHSPALPSPGSNETAD